MSYNIDFGEYFLFDELTSHLKGLAAAYPALATLESLGKVTEIEITSSGAQKNKKDP